MRILVPLDGSPTAEPAVDGAIALMRASPPPHELVLVRVVRYPVYIGEYDATPKAPIHLVEEARDACLDYLRGLIRHRALSDIAVQTTVLIGEPAEQIHAHAQAVHADLLVLTKRGGNEAEHPGMGGIALPIAQQAHLPTLLTNTHPPLPPPASARIVLMLTEDLQLSSAQLAVLGKMLPLVAKEIEVLRVLPAAEMKTTLDTAETLLAVLVTQFTSLGLSAQARLVIGESVEQVSLPHTPEQIIMLFLAPDVPHHALAETLIKTLPYPMLLMPRSLPKDHREA